MQLSQLLDKGGQSLAKTSGGVSWSNVSGFGSAVTFRLSQCRVSSPLFEEQDAADLMLEGFRWSIGDLPKTQHPRKVED